jgi:hypothetical protein
MMHERSLAFVTAERQLSSQPTLSIKPVLVFFGLRPQIVTRKSLALRMYVGEAWHSSLLRGNPQVSQS